MNYVRTDYAFINRICIANIHNILSKSELQAHTGIDIGIEGAYLHILYTKIGVQDKLARPYSYVGLMNPHGS